MNLQNLAEHTANIEFPGKTLQEALEAAKCRGDDAWARIREIETEIQHAQLLLYRAQEEFSDAERAANLFENALDEENALRDENDAEESLPSICRAMGAV